MPETSATGCTQHERTETKKRKDVEAEKHYGITDFN